MCKLSPPSGTQFTRLVFAVATLFVSAISFSQTSDLDLESKLNDSELSSPTLFRAIYKADYKGLPVSAIGIRELTNTKPGEFKLTSSAKSFFATIENPRPFGGLRTHWSLLNIIIAGAASVKIDSPASVLTGMSNFCALRRQNLGRWHWPMAPSTNSSIN